MHPEALAYVTRVVKELPPRLLVVELGSHNHNGGVRHLFTAATRYVGVDLLAGPGVDVVADAATYDPDFTPTCVIATELLEHTPAGEAIIANAYRMLAPNGVIIITTATTGRNPHGVDGGALGEHEHYANIRYHDLRGWLIRAGFETFDIEVDDVAHDIRAWAVKDG